MQYATIDKHRQCHYMWEQLQQQQCRTSTFGRLSNSACGTFGSILSQSFHCISNGHCRSNCQEQSIPSLLTCLDESRAHAFDQTESFLTGKILFAYALVDVKAGESVTC